MLIAVLGITVGIVGIIAAWFYAELYEREREVAEGAILIAADLHCEDCGRALR